MKKKLVMKELFFTIPAPIYLFSLPGAAMLLIPSYPCAVGVGYCLLAVWCYFLSAASSRDKEFSASLPVSRADIVFGRTAGVVALELLQIASCGVTALIADFALYRSGDLVGLDPNFAFFGVMLLALGATNIVLLPGFFASGRKAGAPMVGGIAAFLAVYGAAEALVRTVPALRFSLDSLSAGFIWARLLVFIVGAAAYAALTFLAYRVSVRRLTKADR